MLKPDDKFMMSFFRYDHYPHCIAPRYDDGSFDFPTVFIEVNSIGENMAVHNDQCGICGGRFVGIVKKQTTISKAEELVIQRLNEPDADFCNVTTFIALLATQMEETYDFAEPKLWVQKMYDLMFIDYPDVFYKNHPDSW